MNKTLPIQLSDQRKELASMMSRAIYGELKGEHPGWCAFSGNPENNCDCALSQLVEMVGK